LGKFGAFIGCSNYPECRYTRPLEVAGDGDGAGVANGPRVLGIDPDSGLEVTLRKGPYGFYVQLGEAVEKTKPKRASLTKAMTPDSVDLQMALDLLALPRDIGPNPETGDMITAGIGRYGPYIRHGDVYVSLKGDDDVLGIGLNRAVVVLAEAPKKAQPKKLGGHPDDGKPVTLRSGRFGDYVQHGSLRANLPKGHSADDLTLEAAVEILAAKAAKGGKGNKKPRAVKTKRRRQTTPS
jgi:DNA topoisomerase-1